MADGQANRKIRADRSTRGRVIKDPPERDALDKRPVKAPPRMPSRVQVGPTSFKVEHDPASMNQTQMDSAACLYGCVRYATQTIHVNPAQGPDLKKDTLLHEVLHALIWQCGLQGRFDGESEEEFVRALSPMLLDTLQRNPKMVSYLTGRQ